MKVKIFNLLLVATLLFTGFNIQAVSAQSNIGDSKIGQAELVTLVFDGNQILEENNPGLMMNANEQKDNIKIIRAKEVGEGTFEIVEKDGDVAFDYVVQTSSGQFQAVGKKTIDINSLDDVLNDPRISDVIKEDIVSIAKTIKDSNQENDVSLAFYSPNILDSTLISGSNLITPSGQWLPPMYYTGWKGHKYKDENLVITDYRSRTADIVMTQNKYQQVYDNMIQYVIAFLIDAAGSKTKLTPISGVVNAFLSIFGYDPSYGGNTGDMIKVYITENKTRRYTSIMYPSNDYS